MTNILKMKRLSKMAYELRDVTIFYERKVSRETVKDIALSHNRSTSRICQILRIQMVRYDYYIKKWENDHKQCCTSAIVERYFMQRFYHYEIGLILQRYYIRIKK